MPYGIALGLLGEHAAAANERLRAAVRFPAVSALALLVLVLAAWHHPIPPFTNEAATTVIDGDFSPQWLRVAPEGCASIENADATDHRLDGAPGMPVVPAGGEITVCFPDEGVLRVKASGEPFSGGFVIVDGARRVASPPG